MIQSPGPLCVEYEPRPLSQEEKEVILNIHNRMRSDVALGKEVKGDPGPQPQASDMMQMRSQPHSYDMRNPVIMVPIHSPTNVWDDELARIAQQWADQCTPVHDDCRNVDIFRSGQNLGIRGMDGGFPDEIMVNIDEWFNEVSLVQPNTVKQYPGYVVCRSSTGMVGHYTQLVWSRSLYVGCGASLFLKDGTWYSEYLVCNYGPAGNVRTEPVYLQGTPCSACPNGTVCSDKYEGLCRLLNNKREAVTLKSRLQLLGLPLDGTLNYRGVEPRVGTGVYNSSKAKTSNRLVSYLLGPFIVLASYLASNFTSLNPCVTHGLLRMRTELPAHFQAEERSQLRSSRHWSG
uniref:(California timema) hypothetical protein n=1 Tax=Timema californicum TaxID=61474 RepID=A0A7R9P819_TIMCA|nr:unnamed protein product [Timema californicum]